MIHWTLIERQSDRDEGGFPSRQYSHFVLSNIQFSKCIALFVGPGLVTIFVKDSSDITQWRYVWLTFTAVLLIVSCRLKSNICHLFQVNCLFYCTVTDQPAAFTKITRQTVEEAKAAKVLEKKEKPIELY